MAYPPGFIPGLDTTEQTGIYSRQGRNQLVARYAYQAGGLITSENALWGNCPLLAYFMDPSIGVMDDNPFNEFDSTNDWTGTQATAGSAAVSTTVPGALLMNSGDTTIHHGFQVQKLTSAFIPAAGKDIWFECRLQLSFLTTEIFAGLAASDTTIIAGGAMTTNNRIGWTGVLTTGVVQYDCDKAGTGTQVAATTLSTSAITKLGFFYDGTADTCQQFINGVATGAPTATANISKLVMFPSFTCQNAATDQATMTIAGYRCFQLR